ncbi:MAG: phosphodiester glycosidase family protein [Clostridia bacterium]|nr:phosphodiester glycosidase family protein [Clostridia bacterium]
MKKVLIALLLLLSVCGGALADLPERANEPCARPEVEKLGENGFLTEPDEFVFIDEAAGLWYYVSDELRVEIDRYSASDRKLIWYVAHLYQKTPTGLRTALSNERKPYDDRMWVYDLAKREKMVFATNGDYFATRLDESAGVGIVIRHGRVISSKGKASSKIPTREIIAMYEDGSMKCYGANEYKASTLAESGVRDTLCFGPILVRDGQVETKRLDGMGSSREPRCAIGMVEPGHYVAILTEGRTDTSIGARLLTLGDMMAAEGCVEALNLDGGQSAVMCFMGKMINTAGKTSSSTHSRKMTDIVGIGYSELIGKEQ